MGLDKGLKIKDKDFRYMENYLQLSWGKVWYKRVGNPGKTPLMLLHGGPGYPSDYLWNLEKLGGDREIIFYDQSGCGRSDRNLDQALWTVEHFVEELSAVREQLQLDQIHLLGHSWGTMLVADYMLTNPKGVISVILASPCVSSKLWSETCEKHLAEMPHGLGGLIRQYEARGATKDPVYRAARHQYHTTYECRIDPEPPLVQAANAGFGAPIYRHMWGNNEYTITGTLKDYDRIESLSIIHVPTLITCGAFDSASSEACSIYQSRIPGSHMQVFQNSSHMAHLEEEEKFLEVVNKFLLTVDSLL